MLRIGKNSMIETRFSIHPQTFDFHLPEDRIAQSPLEKRDQAKMLVFHKDSSFIEHKIFSDIIHFLKAGDVLVLNKAKVNKAKVYGRKPTGGKVEVIFIEPLEGGDSWRALVRPQIKENLTLVLSSGNKLLVERQAPSGEWILKPLDKKIPAIMNDNGELPLPPYIHREENDERKESDGSYYQTVYSSAPGSIAAPTAGLHFTPELLEELKAKQVEIVELLLHVGWGTFKPISIGIENHQMLSEKFEISKETLTALVSAKKEGRRIISVGTTSTRALESIPLQTSPADLTGATDIFIKPGYQFQWINGLITNLHVPRSTPLSLTSALMGLNNLEKSYQEALEKNYRFYSYGDAMLII
jgi:S-adenosylmethionine:tRNA ribosyltransferase-isomerase